VCNSNIFVKISNKTIRKALVTEGVRVSKTLQDRDLLALKQRVPEDMITYSEEDGQKNWTLRPESDLTIRNCSWFGVGQSFYISGRH